MVRVTRRTELVALLNDPLGVTLLLLSGDGGSKAEEVHDLWEGGRRKPWRKAVLIADRSILRPDERSEWGLDADERYVLLGRTTNALVEKNATSALLRSDREPSIRKLLALFLRGDSQ